MGGNGSFLHHLQVDHMDLSPIKMVVRTPSSRADGPHYGHRERVPALELGRKKVWKKEVISPSFSCSCS